MANDDGSKGESLPNAASGDDVEVILGEGRYMEGLVEGLLGATVGETVQVTVTFPERLKDKTLAGKTAIFDVTVESASSRSLPELDDAFAAQVREGLTIESLNAEVSCFFKIAAELKCYYTVLWRYSQNIFFIVFT